MIIEARKIIKELPFKETAFASKKFVRVVEDVSFTIRKGETLGVVGETGCGKTTVSLICAGIIEPTSGEILFEGKKINGNVRFLSRRRQVVFQNALGSLNDRLTIEKIIAEPLIIHKMLDRKERTKKTSEMMEVVGLSKKDRDKYPAELSGGQQQRVAIARALIISPKLLILDEPVSSLDVSMQGQILNLLMDLQEKNDVAYLFVTHDLSLIRHISTKIAVMYFGKIVELSPASELFSHPWHPYTNALISAIPIPDPRVEKRRKHFVLKGEVPSLLNRPKGCVFSGRCLEAEDICFKRLPELEEIEENRFVACHFRKIRVGFEKENLDQIKKFEHEKEIEKV